MEFLPLYIECIEHACNKTGAPLLLVTICASINAGFVVQVSTLLPYQLWIALNVCGDILYLKSEHSNVNKFLLF